MYFVIFQGDIANLPYNGNICACKKAKFLFIIEGS